ncbi:serine/threonine-protein kinase [Chamaesiphon sp. GL140_3_metabinner_50]|uniref:serine/threonine protein kinase n=1 Tax=Chamaesiphon sp. GL140_3_metabinner_50 TaxID=2970812 RepID=UPI0025CCD658|nr:serine/threonine-protein kinase [Chamaesiphon sp. GL140_3_metabinner_50]
MELLIDRVLNQRYQIQSLLGRQTGRRTFLAQDLQTERSVVLKLLLFGVDFTWDDLKLFEREAEVLRSLDLPTIPKYLDCFDVDTELGKGFVLVQTYIEAKSLQNWLDSGRTFSEDELISIARQLLTILDYLHNRQPAVIHRDIKPSNILLGDRSGNSPGQIYLVDFGSVKTAAGGSTITVVGTYGYMPPEQFGGHTSPASDLYALGATIICLATGQHPSELPHRDMQIDFVDALSERLHQRVNLSSGLTNWLKSLTEISIDSRLKSASVALLALTAPNMPEIFTFQRQPLGSKVKLKNTDRVFEISIPPNGFHWSFIITIPIAVFLDGVALRCIVPGLLNFSSGGWMLLLFMSPFAYVGIILTRMILSELIVTRTLRIDESEISLSLAIFGLRCFTLQTAPRQYLNRIELVPFTYTKDAEGDLVPVLPHLNIWAENTKFCLDNFYLTQPEREWLVHELTEWLDLPHLATAKAIRTATEITVRNAKFDSARFL